jgi:putative ABC transport system permease protein
MPDFATATDLAPRTVVAAVVVGIVTAGLAPLLLTRRLRRINLPDTLRVME